MEYERFNLALNLNGGAGIGQLAECNPGGSTICWTPTKGCGSGAMTCVGTSTSLTSMEVQVSLPPDERENLQREMAELLKKYAV